ncbi:uroporphyrinogen-III C-methyltransferase [Vibrio cholerae]|uniref:uroporphyrinogen-III C-methyltransferase n=1 Tax=Vibrio cholerae TaxID=666 RepID=UPI0018F0AB01|nr:uroporphyrinogen-III C-methyltransferase [Vibrio cholerae]EKE6109072.1 uroporphyrinogen-III C-methyltransferase [Vibrio cholerae]EKF9749226.1 uroporphyrinogen-III C-methyltransferase [Vibrio cholerae]MBJ6910100.1 uroporphyrinogen-III C-methyltransferase [Vibrio cholerae]MDV2340555.1 uroporphyrinogen-III C-methyltransferase [Vibrio cholerae]GHZ13951.1 uroporphyrin-III C-methyltransferase, putative [Vibrio cholerae]
MTNNNKPQQEPETTVNPSSAAVTPPTAPDKQDSPAPNQPAAKKTLDSTPAQTPPPQPNSQGKKLASVALLLVLALGAGFAYVHQQQKSQFNNQLQAVRAELKQTRDALNAQLEQTVSKATSQATEITHRAETVLEQQQKSIESLQLAVADIKGRRPNDWLLAEADYLVKLAGRKLFLEHDVETATQLMESADQRIAALNDPSLTPLRKAMANDITTLKNIPLIDRDGLVLRLISLQQQIDSLPLANAILPADQPQTSQAVSENIDDWQTNLKNSLKAFADNFITFRSRDGNVIPLLSPTQHFYLRENLQAKLETAIKGVYTEQQTLYRTALDTAAQWSTSFFNPDDKAVQSFNAALAQLAQQQVQVEYPVKLQAQQQLADVINERLRRSVSPLTTGAEQ